MLIWKDDFTLKKYFSITIIILLVSVLFLINSTKKSSFQYPPDISVTYNQNKIETVRGDYTWADKETVGNSFLADDPLNLVKNLKTTSVKRGEEIKFTFDTSWKQPNETIVYLVNSGIGLDKQIVNKDSFNAPMEKGEYIFSICGSWDEGHNVVYVFKINVI